MRVLALEPSFQRKRAQEKALAAEWAEAWDAFMGALQGTTPAILKTVLKEWAHAVNLPPFPLSYKPSSEGNRLIHDFVERVHLLEAIEQTRQMQNSRRSSSFIRDEIAALRAPIDQTQDSMARLLANPDTQGLSQGMNLTRRDQRIAELEQAIGMNATRTQPPDPPNLDESLRPEAIALRRRLDKAAAAPAKNWNEQRAIDAIKRQFALLDVPLPEIVVADSPFEARQIAEAKQALLSSKNFQGPLLAEMDAIAQQSAPNLVTDYQRPGFGTDHLLIHGEPGTRLIPVPTLGQVAHDIPRGGVGFVRTSNDGNLFINDMPDASNRLLTNELDRIARQSLANLGTSYSDLPPTFIIDGETATWTNGRVVTNASPLALEVRHRDTRISTGRDTLLGTAFGTKKGTLFDQCRANAMVWVWKDTWQTAYNTAAHIIRDSLRSPFWTDIHALLRHDDALNTLPNFRHILFELDYDAPVRLAMIQTGIPVEETPTSGNAQTLKQFDAFLEAEIEAFEAGLGFYLEVGDLFILTPAPTVLRDEQGRLHSDEKPAIQWRDGSGFFFLHGVAFDKNLWKNIISRDMTFSETMAIENMEQRQQALYYADAESLLAENEAILLDTYAKKRSDGTDIHYALYEIPPRTNVRVFPNGVSVARATTPFPNGAFYVLYDDATPTGRKYLSGVPDGSRTVPEAMAAKFRYYKRRMTPEEWKRLSPMTTET